MTTFLSTIAGIACAVYLIIPVVLGVYYMVTADRQKTPTKTRLIIKNISYTFNIIASGVIIYFIDQGLESQVNHIQKTHDLVTPFVMLNTIVLLCMVILGIIIRMFYFNMRYVVNKNEYSSNPRR